MPLHYFIDEETRYPSQLTLTLIFIALAMIVVGVTYFNAKPMVTPDAIQNTDVMDNPISVSGPVSIKNNTINSNDNTPDHHHFTTPVVISPVLATVAHPAANALKTPATPTSVQPAAPIQQSALAQQSISVQQPGSTAQQPSLPLVTNTSSNATATMTPTWHVVTITDKTNLTSIFTQLGLDQTQSFEILKQRLADHFLQHLTPGQEVHVQIGPDHKLLQLQYPIDVYRLLVVRPTEENHTISSTILPLELQKHEREIVGVSSTSLLSNLAEQHVPKRIMDEVKTILSWQDHSLQQHDHYRLIFNDYYFGQHEVRSGHLLAAQIEKAGKTFTAIRYVDRHGNANYYSPSGNPLHASFIRYPMHFSHISSPFSAVGRYHPILHLFRPHLGVDLAAPIGTPVHAVADGVIKSHGYSGGYGNAVVIDHGHGYSTLYGHLWHFASGEHLGSRVHQGEVIGYVGETGLATGPHCHYEIRVNGIHYDPSKVKLPGGGTLPIREHHDFAILANKVLAELKTQPASNGLIG